MSIIKTTSKFQIVIPERMRIKLGIRAGQRIMMAERDGAIILTPLPSDPIEFLCGVLEGQQSVTRELVAERAQEIERE